jgi:signal transduction histidine kinase
MNQAVGKGARIGFALAVLALLVSGWLSYDNLGRIRRNDGRVIHTHEVLDEIRDTLSALAAAESSQRSYLITGDTSYLQPYHASSDLVQGHVARIRSLTGDNPAQQARLTNLKPMIDARLLSFGEGVAARDAEGVEGAARYVLLGRGKREMNSIRTLMGEIEQEELSLLAIREEESRVSHRTAVITLWAMTLLGLAMVGAAYRFTARELEARRRGAEDLARANDELEGRVRARTVDLHSANESLQRSNRELEQFASVASHDLQEPLRKIQAFGDRLNTKFSAELDEQGRDYLSRMLASATRMRTLIDALLTFSRITTKAQPFVPVDLGATTEEVISDLEDRIQRSGGQVEVGTLPTLEADPNQMRQLLQNLISNALKFARPDRPPVVRVESRKLNHFEGQVETIPRWEIAVRDNGIGFEEIYLDRIFELFQRLHGRQEYEGTGMGLAICRKIVERHGGTITARSAPESGATFVVTLPERQN